MKPKKYSYYIRPLMLFFDLFIINLVVLLVFDKQYLNLGFLSYINIFWIVSTYFTGFYKIHRYTIVFRLFSKIAVQFTVFFFGYFTYFGVFHEGEVVNNQFLILTAIFIGVIFFKFLTYYALKQYRSKGKNYRNVVLIGIDETSKEVIKLFERKSDLGYRYFGFFSNRKTNQKGQLGTLKESLNYILENGIDEMYCTLSSLNKNEVKAFTKFANKFGKTIKLIPNSNELYSKNLDAEYYDNTLVLNVKRLPLENKDNRVLKRLFDIIFSFLIILFIMSWLMPLLWILIKIESKGPALFKQYREGLGGHQFICYKFRSMKINKLSDKIHATKNDVRITRIGSFMRRTSVDELPQFYNVLLGDMSIVGPRPHMSSLSEEYQKEIDNYLERHAVKPGITGLAQVSGYRGEVKKKSDIKNRVRFDIFYIENWSFPLDIKIILQTAINIFKGEEKAY